MSILLKKLRLINFLSHENTEINFREDEKVLLDGQSGAGKSSILDSIIWALYGQGRADNRSLIRRGTKSGSVYLEVTRGTGTERETVAITRSIKRSGQHLLEVSIFKDEDKRTAHPVTGVRGLQQWIDTELIGASYLLFINSVAYIQGNSESFVTQTAPKRKELLLEIVKAEDYEKYYEKARTKLQELEKEENRIQGQITELMIQAKALDDRIQGKNDLIREVGVQSTILASLAPLRADLEAKQALLTTLSGALEVINSVITAVELEKLKLKENMEKKEDQLRSLPFVGKFENPQEKLVQYNELMSRKPIPFDRTYEIKRIEETIKLNRLELPCPSGDSCPYYSDTLKTIKDNEARKEELIKASEEEGAALDKWEKEFKKIPTLEQIQTCIREKQLKEEFSELFNRFVERDKYLDEQLAKKGEIEEGMDLTVINRVQEELKKIYTEEREANDKLSRATVMLENVDSDETDLKEIILKTDYLRDQELVTINQQRRRVSMVKEAFGSKGLELLVIDYLLPKLEDRINEILSRLSDFRVRLDTQRKSADGENIIEGLFITILNETNEEMPYESYSGGEKLKIMVAISESLAALQKVKFRLFDETFLALDENSTEGFVKVLNAMQADFKQVFCISHLLQVKALFENKITINKTKGISYVQ